MKHETPMTLLASSPSRLPPAGKSSRPLLLPSLVALSMALLVTLVSAQAQAQERAKKRVDVESVQGVLAVRSLDGWLLADSKGRNPIASDLVQPEGTTKRQWFYFIPAFGQPSILVHKSEASAFVQVPGNKLEYTGYRDLKAGLRTLLAGTTTIAMEYAPDSGIRSLTRIDAGTADMVRKLGVTIQSSADLVQFTKSLWGPDGRLAHYTAVHHLTKLREEALAFIAERVAAKRPVTEYDVQVFLANGYRVRGLTGEATIAAGVNSAKPNYQATQRASKSIDEGQLLLLELSGAVTDSERPVYASLSWVAYVGETVPERLHKTFKVVADARDATLAFIGDGVKGRRLVKGFEADQKARNEVGKAGLASRFVHRTGHSLDTSLEGDGANLDDYETHDTRSLVVGSGFTVGPGIYVPGDYGMRSIVDVHVVRGGLEVTTPVQTRITPILLK
jgi:Xaa-Pro aminopeptidase